MPWKNTLMFRLIALLCLALLTVLSPARAEDEFLDPSVAFRFSARIEGDKIAVNFKIAEGYYMYRERFGFSAVGAKLGAPQIPPGKVKFDETFQKEVETYRHELTILIPFEASGPFTLKGTGQGCSDKGLCYSPQDYSAQLGGIGGAPMAEGAAAKTSAFGFGSSSAPQMSRPDAAGPAAAPAAAAPAPSDMGRIESALKSGQLLVIAPLFLLWGLGLAFTPCVLPMVPILSSIIVGEGAASSRSRGLILSVAYSLGMAIVYTALGVAAGLVGEGLGAALQKPMVLIAFGLLMAGLAMSMFGFYELQVPAALQSRLTTVSNRQSSGRLAGVFAMGALSALIVGPCVAAPLAGALVYISQTRDVVVGGGALFAMAVGMSVPLILVGVSAGSLLPRAGAWMDAVKRFFGVLLLAMAWWLVAPVLPPVVQMAGWVALGVGYGMYLLTRPGRWLAKSLGLVFAVLGIIQLVGLATGGRDAWAPLAHLGAGSTNQALHFQRIKTVDELNKVLANTQGKTVMLDFYADWCVSCKEMEKFTFIDPRVKTALVNTIALQVDVTANDEYDKAMLKRFKLFGPPGIIFFDKDGKEIADARVIGFQDKDKFLVSLGKLR
jgi:thiol:disulfide interchange protein DsbD